MARDGYKATLVSAGPAGGPRWLFQPFGRDLVGSAVPLDDRHILVTNSKNGQVAVFDIVERREVANRTDVFREHSIGYTISRHGRTLLIYRGACANATSLPRLLSLPTLTDIASYPSPGPTWKKPDGHPLRLACQEGAERLDGKFVVTLGGGQPVPATTCIAGLDGSFKLNHHTTDAGQVAPRLRNLSPGGRYLIRYADDRLLIKRSESSGILRRFGLRAQQPPRETGTHTIYGIGLEIWSTDPLELVDRIVVHGLSADDLDFIKANRRPGVHVPRMDHIFRPRHLPEHLPVSDKRWKGDGSYWSFPASYMVEPHEYLASITWEDDESGFIVTLADQRRRRVGLDGQVGPMLDPLPLAYPRVPRIRTPETDAADQALAAITRTAISVRDLSEPECVRAVAQLAEQVRTRLSDLVLGHELELVFDVGGDDMDEKAFFGHVGTKCPAAREPLRQLFAAYGTEAPKIELRSVSQLYHDDENGALTFAAAALASIDADAFEHLQAWFDLRDPGHEVGARSYVMPRIAEVGRWRSAAHIRFGLYETARQVLEGTGGIKLQHFAILDGARANLLPLQLLQCVDEVAERLSTRHGYDRDKAKVTLRELLWNELEPGTAWDEAVREGLGVAPA